MTSEFCHIIISSPIGLSSIWLHPSSQWSSKKGIFFRGLPMKVARTKRVRSFDFNDHDSAYPDGQTMKEDCSRDPSHRTSSRTRSSPKPSQSRSLHTCTSYFEDATWTQDPYRSSVNFMLQTPLGWCLEFHGLHTQMIHPTAHAAYTCLNRDSLASNIYIFNSM